VIKPPQLTEHMDFDASQSDSDYETESDMEISEIVDATIHNQGQQSKEIPLMMFFMLWIE